MNPIYVSGHKNPDTDSVASAIAFANLKKLMGEEDYIPARLGELNAESKFVLERFSQQSPKYITTVKTQISDLAFDKAHTISGEIPLRTAWEQMDSGSVNTLPVVDEKKKLLGLISIRDIANSDINAVFHEDQIETTMKNLLTTLNGKQICGKGAQITGTVKFARNKSDLNREGAIVIASYENGIEEEAAKSTAACVIICREAEAQQVQGSTPTIATAFGPYKTARLIYQSTPVSQVMKTKDLISFHLDDYVDDVREVFTDTRYRSYPVIDREGAVVGMIGRDHLLQKDSCKKVVLVDHNDKAQSVPGLEQAMILGIIDHHKLGDIETGHPLVVRVEPVGCCCTIVASLYQENHITPDPNMAGVMLCAILSDTVLFKSPTCTEKDKQMAQYLANLAGVNIEELGNDLFTAGSTLVKEGPEAMLMRDFKEFAVGGKKVGIGQITIWDIDLVRPEQDNIKKLMQEKIDSEGFDMVLFMETSIKDEGTNLVAAGDCQKTIAAAFGSGMENGELYLPGVMSRKKQIVPQITQNI